MIVFITDYLQGLPSCTVNIGVSCTNRPTHTSLCIICRPVIFALLFSLLFYLMSKPAKGNNCSQLTFIYLFVNHWFKAPKNLNFMFSVSNSVLLQRTTVIKKERKTGSAILNSCSLHSSSRAWRGKMWSRASTGWPRGRWYKTEARGVGVAVWGTRGERRASRWGGNDRCDTELPFMLTLASAHTDDVSFLFI